MRVRYCSTCSFISSKGGTDFTRFSSSLMTCQPNWLFTGSETSPGASLKAVSAKGCTMRSLVKKPRSPPSPFEPGSFDSSAATLAKSSPPLTRAAAFLASSSFSLRMWRARTSSSGFTVLTVSS